MAVRPRRVAVIGAGAAGAMAAIFAASGDAETLLLERTPDGGRKILISGGGRCNILPAADDASRRFVTDSSPNTLRKMLRSWPLREQISFFEKDVGLVLAEEKETGKLFPASNRARDVREALFALARRRNVRLLTNTLVIGLTPIRGRWSVQREGAPALETDAVIVATGGLSVPKSGSDGLGLALLAGLGHTVHTTYAALTPLVGAASPLAGLAGISLPVTITARGPHGDAEATGGFLFTHRGYSGPAVLDVSHIAVRSLGETVPARVMVRWTGRDASGWDAALRAGGARTVAGALRGELPDRLAAALAHLSGVDPARPLAKLPREERLRLIETLVAGELPWTGHEGYAKAEVTGGGVSLAEVDPRTLESLRCPGLFICGEALDAFGPIGGYNFQWAWATGRAAGLGAARVPLSAPVRSPSE